MKKSFLIMLCGFVFTNEIHSQIERLDTADIRKATQDIKTNIGSYQKVEKVHTASDDKYVYLKDNEIKLITIRTIDKGIEKNVAWYYSNGQLIYTEQFWIDLNSKKVVDNEKFYLRTGQLIAWVNTESELVDNNSSKFKSVESTLNTFGPKWSNESLK